MGLKVGASVRKGTELQGHVIMIEGTAENYKALAAALIQSPAMSVELEPLATKAAFLATKEAK